MAHDVLRPSNLAELAGLLREAAGPPEPDRPGGRDGTSPGRRRLTPLGSGSQWRRWGRPAEAVLDLRSLPVEPRLRVANLTVVVPAWWRLDDLNALLAPHGLWYPVDTGDGGAATVGGHVAAATAGPRRAGLGGVRDWLLGLWALLPDGREIRPGGEMVKNVAGYDLTRVLAGSLGTLAVFVAASLRVAPRPEHHRTLVARFRDAGAAWAALAGLRRAATTLVAVEWLRPAAGSPAEWTGAPPGGPGPPGVDVLLAFEGLRAVVESQAGSARQALREATGLVALPGEGVAVLEGDAAARAWETRKARLLRPAPALRLRAGVPPARLPELWEAAAGIFAGTLGAAESGRATAWDALAHGLSGLIEIVIPIGGEPDGQPPGPGADSGGGARALAAAVAELRHRAAALGGYLQIRGTPAGFDPGVPWTELTPDAFLHRRLKSVLDPRGVLAGAEFLLPLPPAPAAGA